MFVKIHTAYRKVIAVCDSGLLGKKFEEGDLVLDVNEDFYEGKKVSEDELKEIIKEMIEEDATFNIVGENSIKIAIECGLIDDDFILRIQNIPHDLSLF